MNQKEEFEYKLEELKKETYEKFNQFFKKYSNAKDWKITFDYLWTMRYYSAINKTYGGQFDEMEDLKK